MDILFVWARWLHIVCGFAALLVFWIPIAARKGGKLHNRVGWAYVAAMGIVSVTALFMGVYRIAWNAGPDPDAIPFSWFLIFISVLSSSTAWYGVRVLRHKRRKAAHRQPIDLLFPSLLFVSGIAICIYGWTLGFPLLQYFPLLGLFLGGSQLAYWLKAPTQPSHWIVEHLVGMLSCCISTVTAFLVFGLPRLIGIDAVSLIVWFLPTIVIVPLIIYFSGKYQKKPAGIGK